MVPTHRVALIVLLTATVSHAQWFLHSEAWPALDWRFEYAADGPSPAWSNGLWGNAPVPVPRHSYSLIMPFATSGAPQLEWLNISGPAPTASSVKLEAPWTGPPLTSNVAPEVAVAADGSVVVERWGNVTAAFPVVHGAPSPGRVLSTSACPASSGLVVTSPQGALTPSIAVISTCDAETVTLTGVYTSNASKAWQLDGLSATPRGNGRRIAGCTADSAHCLFVENRSSFISLHVLDAASGAVASVSVASIDNVSADCIMLPFSDPYDVVAAPNAETLIVVSERAFAAVDARTGNALWCHAYRGNTTAPIPSATAAIFPSATGPLHVSVFTNDGTPKRVASVVTRTLDHGVLMPAASWHAAATGDRFPSKALITAVYANRGRDSVIVVSSSDPAEGGMSGIALDGPGIKWSFADYVPG